MRGSVVWFSAPKGYGFLSRADGGNDVFVYFDAIVMDGYKRLDQGDKVEFEIGEKDGRIIATNVRVLERSTDGSAGTPVHEKQSHHGGNVRPGNAGTRRPVQ